MRNKTGGCLRLLSPLGPPTRSPGQAGSKKAENIYGAIHLGTGEEVSSFVIDWQDSEATIRWLELILEEHPQGQILLWLDQAPHHTSEEVEEWLAAHPRLTVIHFPAYTPEENPKEPTWKALKEEVSHHHWHETLADLRQAIDTYYPDGENPYSQLLAEVWLWLAGRSTLCARQLISQILVCSAYRMSFVSRDRVGVRRRVQKYPTIDMEVFRMKTGQPVQIYKTWVNDSTRWAHYQPRAGDIVIATYPKCGTTWMQRIVSLLVFQSPEPCPIIELSPWIDCRFKDSVEEMQATIEAQQHRRFLKSHVPFDGVPYYEQVRYLHVARDGRDACMSFFNHWTAYTPLAYEVLDRGAPELGPIPRAPADPRVF